MSSLKVMPLTGKMGRMTFQSRRRRPYSDSTARPLVCLRLVRIGYDPIHDTCIHASRRDRRPDERYQVKWLRIVATSWVRGEVFDSHDFFSNFWNFYTLIIGNGFQTVPEHALLCKKSDTRYENYFCQGYRRCLCVIEDAQDQSPADWGRNSVVIRTWVAQRVCEKARLTILWQSKPDPLPMKQHHLPLLFEFTCFRSFLNWN